jgi:hypothetical protein
LHDNMGPTVNLKGTAKMRISWIAAIVLAWTGIVNASSAPGNGKAAFERAPDVTAPAGYVAYAVRTWGARVSGHFTEVSVNEYGQLRFRSESDDDGHIGPVTVDHAVRSIIYLPEVFTPSADLLALRVRRPADFRLTAEAPAAFTLRLLGVDPTDPGYRLYETYFPGMVVTGTLSGFELNDAAVLRGYPYRGPLIYHGPTKRRPSRYPGEKSVVRIPASETIPTILLYRP